MPGQTPKYKIPYPVSSDALNQGAIAAQNMANRIELILDAAGIPAPASLSIDDAQRAQLRGDQLGDDAGPAPY